MNARSGFLPLAGALVLIACSHTQPTPTSDTAPPQQPSTAAQATPPAEEAVPVLTLPTDERPTHYALHFTVDPTHPGFSGTADIDVTLDQARQTLWLNGRDLQVSAAWVEAGGQRQNATYKQVAEVGVARLDLPAKVGP